jgi:hypothetical protein
LTLFAVLLSCNVEKKTDTPAIVVAPENSNAIIERTSANKTLLDISDGLDPAPNWPAPDLAGLVIDISVNNLSAQIHNSFLEDASVTLLEKSLQPFFGGYLDVIIGYDNSAREGEICVVPNISLSLDNPFPLQIFLPLVEPLKKYRSKVGSSADMRIHNFNLCIKMGECIFRAKRFPKKRIELISPCITIGNTEVCGEANPHGVFFSEKHALQIQNCLLSPSP